MRTAYGCFCATFCLFLGASQVRASVSICNSDSNNLVANCGFETGTFTSWTLSGNDVPLELGNLYGVEGTDPLDGINPNSGTSQAFFADLVSKATTLSQSLSTVSGTTYTVSWYLAQDTQVGTQPTESNGFSASFGGVTLTNITAVPVQGYTLYSFAQKATSSSSVLTFKLGNDLGEFLLDDVDVAPVAASSVPEPSSWVLVLGGVFAFILYRKQMTMSFLGFADRA